MIKFFYLIPLVIFVAQSVQAEVSPIDGAFGIKLGDSLKAEYRAKELPTKIGKLFFVTPPIENDHFNEYAVLVTHRTNKIFRIYAEKEQSTISCNEEILKVKKSLEKIYGTLTVSSKVFSVKQKEKEINLTCKISIINKEEASLQIKYVDRQVYEEGHEKTDPNRNDASGL